MNSLDDAIAQLQLQPLSGHGGQELGAFLESSRELLDRAGLYFSVSHTTLWISKYQKYCDSQTHPAVSVHADNDTIDVAYQETWEGGPSHHGRRESVRCHRDQALVALTEFLNRLKIATA